MKKILFILAVGITICVGAGISSCKELEKAASSIDKEQRAAIIATIIEDGLGAISTDSNSFLAGTWAYTDNNGTFDTLWISTDSVITNHYKDKEIDLIQTGGYLYYSSYKQALVQYNGAHNYKTGKDLENWSQTLIYAVSKTKMSLLNMNQLTMTELDQTTGESLGSTTYTWVSDNTSPTGAQ